MYFNRLFTFIFVTSLTTVPLPGLSMYSTVRMGQGWTVPSWLTTLVFTSGERASGETTSLGHPQRRFGNALLGFAYFLQENIFVFGNVSFLCSPGCRMQSPMSATLMWTTSSSRRKFGLHWLIASLLSRALRYD